jgi:hypothetical protein
LCGSLLACFAAVGLAVEPRSVQPLVLGIDHVPIVVGDLNKAEADYRSMGFAIKPGRFHVNGIQNSHVKFADGTELELITAPRNVDALTSEYRLKLQSGEGPVYFGLFTPDTKLLRTKLSALNLPFEAEGGLTSFPSGLRLHPMFFGTREKALDDKPEYFAHPNTSVRLTALWVGEDEDQLNVLNKLGVNVQTSQPCGPIAGRTEVARLPDGDLYLVKNGGPDRSVLGARLEVRDLKVTLSLLVQAGLSPEVPSCASRSLWISPARGHGIWLQFVQRGLGG